MAAKTYDYSAFTAGDAPAIGDNMLVQLSATATDLFHAEARVARLEDELKEAKETARHIRENQLPTLMESAGMEEFKTKDGLEIKIATELRGSIPKDHEEEAFAYLEEHNDGGLIKRQFVIDFGRDEEGWARKFMRDLSQRKRQLNTKIKRTVPPQTVKKYVREKLEEGVDIPMDVFGVFRQRFARVKQS